MRQETNDSDKRENDSDKRENDSDKRENDSDKRKTDSDKRLGFREGDGTGLAKMGSSSRIK